MRWPMFIVTQSPLPLILTQLLFLLVAISDLTTGNIAYTNNYDGTGGSTGEQKKQPVVTTTYLITSTTSQKGGEHQGMATSTSASPMQPAFVYDATMPKEEEPPYKAIPSLDSSVASIHQLQHREQQQHQHQQQNEVSKKVIGSSMASSVSIVLNGNEPQFTDALGHKVPKPQPSLQVASPIDLLNPDRYEFYTFDEHGELVKRLMTMQEIQSIVANGDGERPSIIHPATINEREPEKNVQDIVNSVQSVLNKEVASSKNNSSELLPLLDTPDVSSSWSLILPAIFSNSGGDIFPQHKPQQVVMQPESELLDTSTKASPTIGTKKPKPLKRKPGNKRKPSTTTTTTEMTPQVVQEELDPMESVYTGMQQYQHLAANMQNFDMHMQPIYNKLPSSSTPKPESTTRRVFYNNQEIIQTPSMTSIAGIISSTEKIIPTQQLGKKPANVLPKPSVPNRVKKPSASSSTTSSSTTSSNTTTLSNSTGSKQKVKKKTTTSTSTTTSTTTTTATPNTDPTPSPNIPSEITTAEALTSTTTTSVPTVATTPKKKKRKPTRTSAQAGTSGSNKPSKPKRKPTSRPKPGQETAEVAASSQQQQVVSTQKPRPHRPNKKPSASSGANKRPSTTTTTTTTEASPTKQPSEVSSSSETTQEISTVATPLPTTQETFVQVNVLKKTPPPKPSQSPSTALPPTSESDPMSYIHSPTDKPVKEHNQIKPHRKPVQTTINPIRTETQPTNNYNETPLYPVPNYESTQQLPIVSGDLLKKEPLPSLALIQQQLKHEIPQTSPVPQLTLDQIQSMDQIVQSLTQTQGESATEKTDESTFNKPIIQSPVKYDSAENAQQVEQLANKKKIAVVNQASTTPTPIAAFVTTEKPLTAHYGGSTLATMLAEEDENDKKQSADSNESASTEKGTTINSDEVKSQTPVVVITARPQYFASTKVPETMYTNIPTESLDNEPETTELPGKTQFLGTTAMYTQDSEDATSRPATEPANVVKFESLYAEIPEAIVTELKDEVATTDSYTQEIITDSSVAKDPLDYTPRLPVTARPQVAESATAADDDSTEVTPLVIDLVPQLNLNVIKPTDQISMSDFQTQAATVASTLVDGSNTLLTDVFMNSNETKDELEFLISDVLQQITGDEQHSQYKPTDNTDNDSHRLTNYAQLNTSFLLKPPQQSQTAINKPGNYVSSTEAPSYQSINGIEDIQTKIPSNEELIKQETIYSDTYNAPTTSKPDSIIYDTTTFKIPILSLSEIYAQQQQNEDEAQELFEKEREETTDVTESSPYISTTTLSTETTLYPEKTTEQTNYGTMEEITNKIEETTASELSQTSDQTYSETKRPLYEAPSEGDVEQGSEESMPEMLTNGYEEQISQLLTDSTEPTILNNSGNGEQTEEFTETSQTDALSMYDQTTNANVYQDQTTVSSKPEHTSTTSTYTNLNEEQNNYQHTAAANKPESNADSTTDAAEVEPQYTILPSEEDSSTTTAEQQNGNTSEEMAVVSNESNLSFSSEQETDSIKTTEQQQEATETTSNELMATISEEAITEEQTEDSSGDKVNLDNEDPYIKLGETTASLVKPNDNKNALKVSEYDINPLNNTDQADEEDDDDQTNYQQSMPINKASMTTIIEPTTTPKTTTTTTSTTTTTTTKAPPPTTTKRLHTLKPVSYYVQPSLVGGYNQLEPPKLLPYNSNNAPQQRPMQRPASLTNLMATSTQATRPPVKLDPSPNSSKGLEASIAHLDEDVKAFTQLCNELAFSYWKAITSEKISSARSLVLSPFALTSMLSMMFLGARGSTSGEMNEILKLDDMVSFNPHLIFKNITSSVEQAFDSDIATAAFVREIFSDRGNGKILPFFKEKTQQLYAGHVEEVNFHVVNDIIRRRTNLLVKRHTMGKVLEYLRTNSVWVNGPLATISANLFQTDCSHGSTVERDGEMFFQVHPTVRQRRLVPIPAVLYRSGFTAGYEAKLDATIVAFGRIQDTVSTIYVMPGHQSSVSPTDNLDRLERNLVDLAISENAWSNLLTALMDRPGMEVQLPRFSHRSFVNASLGLQKMGLKGLFKSDFADLRGLTGTANREIFLSDMIQINTFSTCGEEKISDHHHVEMYPAPPLRKRNKDVDATDDTNYDSSEAIIDFGSLVQESALGRGFYDDLLDPKYLELPLPLRPRQARVPDAPRLRFDKPFLYFTRHNPTGMILFMGRFNPRLLP